MWINKITQTLVGADVSRTPPMYRPSPWLSRYPPLFCYSPSSTNSVAYMKQPQSLRGSTYNIKGIMSTQLSYLIIGNGITGITAAEILRSDDPSSVITIVADDPYPVYYRPALKDYLSGKLNEQKLWARPDTFYQEQRIRFVQGHAIGINTVQNFVQLDNRQRLGYHKLLLANGARPKHLSCPGLNLAGMGLLPKPRTKGII